MNHGDLYVLLGLPQDTSASDLRVAYERAMAESSRGNHFSRMAQLSGALDRLPLSVRQGMYRRRGGVPAPQRPQASRFRRRPASAVSCRGPGPIVLGLVATAAGCG